MPSPSSTRLPWIDHLRTLVILLVVNVHACVTYSHVGDWYYMSDHEPTLAAKVPFIVWQGHLQSFFMGFLFFVSGYFAAGSLARRGPAAFNRERLFRLGLPALFYMLVIHPFILLGLNPWHADFGSPVHWYFARHLGTGRFLGSTGPLWFAVALLSFCLVLAALRALRRPQPEDSSQRPEAGSQIPGATAGNQALAAGVRPLASGRSPPVSFAAPSGPTLFLAGLIIGLLTFAVRLVQPIGTSILNMQLCFFPQYIVFFAAGVHAARHGWLLMLARSRQARIAGWLALIGGPVVQLTIMSLGTRAGQPIEFFFGGPHWQAFALAVWEQLTGLGLSLGLLALFSAKLDFETPLLRWLSDRSFGVYVLHAPILVALTMLYRTLPLNLYGFVALLTASGLVASFIAADLARRVPGLRAIL